MYNVEFLEFWNPKLFAATFAHTREFEENSDHGAPTTSIGVRSANEPAIKSELGGPFYGHRLDGIDSVG